MNQNDTLPIISETELVELENKIRQGKDAFIAVGNALIEIRDGRGYTLRGFKTFEQYCDKVWGISDRHARRLMSGAEAAETVRQIAGETPANEAVAREFAKVAADPKAVQQVVKKLQTRGGSVSTATAERVAEVVAQVRGKTSETKPAERAPEISKPAAPVTFTDECPGCRQVPQSYWRNKDGWHCEHCEALVFVGVVAATAQINCQHCKKSVTPGALYCDNCGGLL